MLAGSRILIETVPGVHWYLSATFVDAVNQVCLYVKAAQYVAYGASSLIMSRSGKHT